MRRSCGSAVPGGGWLRWPWPSARSPCFSRVSSCWGPSWSALARSIVIAVMMVSYVAAPARLIGMKTTHSTRDKLTATVVGGAIGAVVCTPPYVLGRVGLLMLGSHTFFILGV